LGRPCAAADAAEAAWARELLLGRDVMKEDIRVGAHVKYSAQFLRCGESVKQRERGDERRLRSGEER
jgi:hypothetical protein